jgi:cell division protein FtsZ
MKKIKKRKPAFAKSTAGKVKKIKKAVKKNKAKKIIKKKNKPVKKANKRKTRKIVKRIKALKKTQKAKKSKKVTKIKKIKRIKKAKKARKIVKKSKTKRRKPSFAKAMEGRQDNVRKPRIMIIGVGGGGCSIINEVAGKLKKVSFVAANTDTQALQKLNRSVKRFQLGKDLTHGLGCGMNPNLGRICAKNEKERIIKLFENIDLCILVSCLGGGAGSGATPVFAELLRELKKTSLGVFCLPFKFEGEKKSQIARNSLEKMTFDLNAQIVLFNEKIFKIIDQKTPLKDSFSSINKKLIESLEGLVEMIYLPGLINIDFADLKMILQDQSKIAFLNSVKADGPNRAEQAAKKSLKNPLNEYNIETTNSSDVSVPVNTSGLRLIPERILFNITASHDLKMREVEQISKIISSYNKQARIVFGVSYNKKYGDKLRITLLATGKKEVSPVKKLKKLLNAPVSQIKDIPQEKPKEQVEKKEVEKKIEIVKPKQIKKLSVKLPMKLPIKPVAKIPTKLSVKPSVKTPVKPIVQTNTSSRLRKNALDIKKEIEHIEEEMLLEEKKWDTPAFLRRKEQHE